MLGNDISGFADPDYLRVAAAHGAAVVATHIRLAPRVPDPEPVYTDLVGEVSAFLVDRAGRALAAGIPPDGCWSTPASTWARRRTSPSSSCGRRTSWPRLGYPLLLSASNKTFLGVVLGLEITERREATASAHALGITLGLPGGARSRRARHMPGAGHAGRHPRRPGPWGRGRWPAAAREEQ